jgi:hypothetical protein
MGLTAPSTGDRNTPLFVIFHLFGTTPARADVIGVVHAGDFVKQRFVVAGHIRTDQLRVAAEALVHHAQLQLRAPTGDHTAPAKADVVLELSSSRGSSSPSYIGNDQLRAAAAGALVQERTQAS